MADFIIFIFGAVIGSFLNVVIFRLEKEDIVKKRSHCPLCGRNLAWYDLIPIASFFILRGRCRNCRKKISWQYPLVEAATGVLFIAIFSQQFPDPNFQAVNSIGLIYWFFIISCCIVIFVYDLRHYIIPDKVLWPAVAAALLWRGYSSLNIGLWPAPIGYLWPYLLSGFAAAAFFLFLVLATRGRGMGMGDAKLALLMGLVLGWPNILPALFLAFFMGAAAGLFLVFGPPASVWLRRLPDLFGKSPLPSAPIFGKNWGKTMQSRLPFGPFLVSGLFLALFWGRQILAWWMRASFG